MKSQHILVTGGAGYIGSHMVRLLVEKGLKPIVFDNLSTGHKAFVPKGIPFVKGDLKNERTVRDVFKKYSIDAVMHFAASVIVSESVKNPIAYFENNTFASSTLCKVMLDYKVHKLIFSSTAAVYGNAVGRFVCERDHTIPTNPYGASKLLVELLLKGLAVTSPLRFISLRYFNVAGSHPSGDIGIRSRHVTHLIPSIVKVASGGRKQFVIHGDDYDTRDGTCIRDYIYVMDLCDAHLCALNALDRGMKSDVFNLGNEKGFSVKEVLSATRRITGKKILTHVGKRRPGDAVKVIASSQKAKSLLKWKPRTSLDTIIITAWQWEMRKGQHRPFSP